MSMHSMFFKCIFLQLSVSLLENPRQKKKATISGTIEDITQISFTQCVQLTVVESEYTCNYFGA